MARKLAPVCLIACFHVLVSAAPVRAQAVDDEGQWNAFFGQGDFQRLGLECDRLRWWFDGHLRYFDDTQGFNQSIVRPALGWALTEQSTVWAGYGWIRTSPITGPDFDEHRLWQQWTWSKSLEHWGIAHRSRFEQRLVETGDDVGLRFRQLLRVQRDLPACPKLMLVGWNEIFYHLNDTDWGAESGFDQNRAFAGIGIRTGPNAPWRTEIGYLNQVIENPTTNDRNHHILSINVYWNP